MEPLVLIIQNEKAYLSLIADCYELGAHCLNRFATPNSDGLALSDQFDKLPADALYQYLGCYTTEVLPGTLIEQTDDYEVWSEHPITEEEARSGKLVRENMKLHYESESLKVPRPEDYPIMIYWMWYDSWGRMGDIKQRHFTWHSMSEIPVVSDETNPIETTHSLWTSQFQAEHNRLVLLQEAQLARNHSS